MTIRRPKGLPGSMSPLQDLSATIRPAARVPHAAVQPQRLGALPTWLVSSTLPTSKCCCWKRRAAASSSASSAIIPRANDKQY